MIRPAAMAADPGLNPERPWAITSALTKASIPTVSRRRSGAANVFPAPFGPAITTTCGFRPTLTEALSRASCPADVSPRPPQVLLIRPRTARSPPAPYGTRIRRGSTRSGAGTRPTAGRARREVKVGFTPPEVGKRLEPATKRLGTSWVWPWPLATESPADAPMMAPPIVCIWARPLPTLRTPPRPGESPSPGPPPPPSTKRCPARTRGRPGRGGRRGRPSPGEDETVVGVGQPLADERHGGQVTGRGAQEGVQGFAEEIGLAVTDAQEVVGLQRVADQPLGAGQVALAGVLGVSRPGRRAGHRSC